jgi:hypothetical protein
MTIEEKRRAIKNYCSSLSGCEGCKLVDVVGDDWCYEADANVERNYNVLFGNKPDEPDNVNHPSHYETGKIECIDAMLETQGVEAVKNFCICNAFKYIWRHNNKNQLEDVKKAKWYIDKFIELTESEEKSNET